MVKNWLKIYWYQTMKHKMYFLLTVLGLAIGIAAVVLSSLYYLEESSYDQWNPNKNDIYVVENVGEKMQYNSQPLPIGRYIKDNSDAVEDYMYYAHYQSLDVNYQGKFFKVDKVFDVQNNFFSFFPYDFVFGNEQTALVNSNDVAIDLSVSTKLFGKNVNPIGQEIELNDKVYIVSGVYDLADKRSSLMPKVVTNNLTKEVLTNEDWGSSSFPMLVKTQDVNRVSKIITEVMDKNFYAPIVKDKGMSLEEMKSNQLKDLITKPTFYVLNGINMLADKNFFSEGAANVRMLAIVIYLSIIIALLSVFNYINLSLTQIMQRGKEIGVRKVLGASRSDIYRQSIFESFVIVLISFVVAICSIELILPYVNIFFNTDIAFSFTKHLPVLGIILIVIIVLCGVIPAVYVSNYEMLNVLKGGMSKNNKGRYLRTSLLVLQFVIACFFIVCSLIINKQVNYMLDKELGFKGDQVFTVPFLASTKNDSIRYEKYQNFRTELEQIEGVSEVATSAMSFDPYEGRTVFSFFEYGEKKSLMHRIVQDYEFMDLMQIQLKEGRMLTSTFASDSINNVLVNESLVESLGIENPINAEIISGENKYTIVGVVHNFHITGVESSINPMIYGHFNTFGRDKGLFDRVYIKVDTSSIENTIAVIEKVWAKYHIGDKSVFSYEFVDQTYARTFGDILAERRAFSILNYLVVFIALFGLFAVSSFTIGTKLKEIAIRKVLGAETSGLLKQLSYQYVVYCLIGFVIAVYPSYYFLNEWLGNYAYRIEIGFDIYIYSLLLILALTLTIVLSRAYYATKINVLKYIKYE